MRVLDETKPMPYVSVLYTAHIKEPDGFVHKTGVGYCTPIQLYMYVSSFSQTYGLEGPLFDLSTNQPPIFIFVYLHSVQL